MADYSVTYRLLHLGARDDVTGWFDKDWNETSGEAIIVGKGAQTALLGSGFYVRTDALGFTLDTSFDNGDELIDDSSRKYHILNIHDHYAGDKFLLRTFDLSYMGWHVDRPGTSGTWHLDSDSAKTDPRYRIKLWLDTYLNIANMKADNGVDAAATLTSFDEADYPLIRVFDDEGYNGIFSIGCKGAEQLTTHDSKPYAFNETVTVTCLAVNTSGITATNLVEQMEQEVRRVCTDYPVGSVKRITATSPECVTEGNEKIWFTTVTIDYKRANDDYTPSATVTYGHNYLVDFTSAECTTIGATEVETGLAATPGNLYDDLFKIVGVMDNVADEYATYTMDPTNFSTDLYTTYVTRWLTQVASTGVGLNIIANFTVGTQALLNSGSTDPDFSTDADTWEVTSGTFTASKTVADFYIKPDDLPNTEAAGSDYVILDFFLTCKGKFTFPNITNLEPVLESQSPVLPMVSRGGEFTQQLGNKSMRLRITCDLSVGDWTRAGDVIDAEVFHEIWEECGHNSKYPWVWLDVGDYAFKAVVDRVQITGASVDRKLVLEVHEYNRASAHAVFPSVQDRLGIE